MSEDIIKEFEKRDRGIDLSGILGIARSYWLLYVIFLVGSIVIAKLTIRYTVPEFKINSSVLLSNEEAGREGSEILGVKSGITGFNPWDPTFVNDKIQVLKSIIFLSPIIDSLGFQDEYYEVGNIKSLELYKNAPFIAEIDFLDKGLRNHTNFNFEFQKSKAKLTVKTGEEIIYQGFCSYNHQLKTKRFNLTLRPSEYSIKKGKDLPDLEGGEYYYRRLTLNKAVSSFRNNLNISQITQTKAIKLSIEHPVVQKGKDFLNAVADAFVEDGLRSKNQYFTNSLEFINEELSKIRDTLAQSELKLDLFKRQNQLVDIPAQIGKLISEYADLRSTKGEEEIRLLNTRNLRDYISGNNDLSTLAPATFGVEDPLLVPLIQNLSLKYNELQQVKSEFGPASTAYQVAEDQLESAKKQLEESSINIEKQTKQILGKFEQRITTLSNELMRYPSIERIFLGLEREFKVQENLYLLLLEKKFEYSIARSGNKSDYRVLNQATLGGQTKPNTKKQLTTAVFIGLIIPSLFIFLRIFLDNKIRSKEQIEKRTNIPFLSSIPHFSGKGQLIFAQNSKSVAAEAYRNLRTSISYMFDTSSKESKSMLVTSTISGEGKTFCTLNLAHVLALSNKRVVILGLDLRKPRLHLGFNIKNDVGISNYLVNKAEYEDILQPTTIENITIIPSGPVPPNPSELILGKRMAELLDQLKGDFDYVLLDTAPLGLVTDAVDLMKQIDLCIYVMRENYTNENAIKFIDEFHKNKTIEKIGIILNDSVYSGSKYGYGYSYGYGYGYGYGYYSEDEDRDNKWWRKLLKRFRT